MSVEQWKDIVGYEGLYRVSDIGRIKSLLCGRILKPWKNKNGKKHRLMISLWKNRLNKRFYMHQLILEAFVGPCPQNMECCHNDGNAENNAITNLRWDTHQNNMKDMSCHGNSNFGEKNPNNKLTEAEVLEIIDL